MIKELIKKLRGKQTRLYRSGWLHSNIQLYGESSSGLPISSYIEMISNTSAGTNSVSQKAIKKEDDRIDKLPIEVYKEILAKIPSIDCTSLDKKIDLVEKRIKVLKTVGVAGNMGNEDEALGFLKARKKYQKCGKLFCWATTTDELIDKLCKKYKVRMVDFGSYQRNVPAEAIDELEKFVNAYDKVRNDTLILKLIVDDKPDSPEKKKDPILLAASPFGAWWYVLGAWDREVEIIDDLIYHKK